jgi:thiol-disulfide isomerase/thioredoxin
MRTLILPVRLLLLSLASVCTVLASGCQSTLSPQIRTIAAVGDRPLPPVAGTPGETVVAGQEEPDRKPSADGRISGRVLDVWGNPVPNARVRLAVSGSSGGNVVKSTTDASGGFTLNGLRPGGSYTVIAESEDNQGLVTGRSVVKAPDGQVRIRLRELQDAPASTTTAAPRVNVSPASNRNEVDRGTDEPPPRRRQSQVNMEDLPPAPEAEALAPDSRDRARSPKLRLSEPVASSGWRRGGSTEPDTASNRDQQGVEVDGTLESESALHSEAAESYAQAEPEDDEEGPNPLPPAIDPGRARGVERKSSAAPIRTVPAPEPEAGSVAPLAAGPEPVSSATTAPANMPVPRSSAIERSAPLELTPEPSAPATEPDSRGDKADVEPLSTLPDPTPDPASTGSGTAESAAQRDDPFTLSSPPALAIRGGSPFASTLDEYDPFAEVGVKPAGNFASAEASPRTTSAPVPPLPRRGNLGLQHAGPDVAAQSLRPARRVAGDNSNSTPNLADTKNLSAKTRPSTPATAVDRGLLALKQGEPSKAYCRYDTRRRQLVDFLLPGLQGGPIRFQDLKSDYVLIDFWGSWCPPCINAIPHLVELQKQFGSDRLTVLGVAYEEGPREERTAAVSEVAQRLKINYPLVLGGLDGPCPLQTALNVKSYPTMVLLDRYGRILWRDQGGSPATLARLDRVLDSAARGDFVRR